MIQLSGNNLCKRQQELNHVVNEAFANKIDFKDIKFEAEASDIDKLYKIDLSAKYKNVDYIIEVLKSGDNLCISRALKKCFWLYDEDYSNVFNTDYLHHNVFPFMSIKMKKKLLSAVSTNLKDENRAEDFYKYCLRVKLANLADKFLIATSESFKLSSIQNDVVNQNDLKYLKRLTGNSFELLEAYLERQSEWNSNILIREFRYLYSVSDVKYLDLLEKHAKADPSCWRQFGLRISKDIITKHRARVLKHPKFYVTLLNRSKLVRHSNAENAKIYVDSCIPKDITGFWRSMRFYKTYKSIIDIIPVEERYAFLKKTFADHYPSEEFDTNKYFYEQDYYNLMSLPEQDDWALRQIASGKEMLGPGRDYLWYKFVRFEKASMELKRYIKITTDHTRRSEIIKVLIESAKNQRELEQLFKYYYEKHVNESRNNKESFMKKVISRHKVLEFDEDCWAAFDKLLHSLEVYNVLGHGSNPDLKVVSILYHILNKKQLPNALEEYLDKNMSSYSFKSHVDNLSDKEKQAVYDFISNFYLKKIESFNPIPQESSEFEKVKSNVSLYIHYLLEFMALYKKTQRDIPEIVMKYVNLDWNSYKYQQILEERNTDTITQQQLLKYLKEDANILVVKLQDVKTAVSSGGNCRIKTLLKKLRIYFVNDIAREYITFFQKLLLEKNLYNSVAASAVFAIFQLSDESAKLKVMMKYAPKSAKIDHNNIDSALLNVQESICRFACYSRPPVPLSTMLLYLKGDYVRYCLPMFHMYLSNLPQPLCIKFVESLIDAPISIQKHGLRLAFKCFNADNLTKLVLDSWKKTKNVSMRSVIYKAFYNKNVEEDSRELFDVLKTLTLDLNEDDDDDLFHILTSNKLSQQFVGEFLEVVWGTVQKFSNNDTNLQRKTNVIRCIDNNLNLIKKNVIKGVIDEQVKTLFDEKEVEVKESVAYFITAKWDLIAHYIVFFTNSETERKEGVALAKSILEKCINKWNDVLKDCYIYRRVCLDFIKKLDQKGYCYNDVVSYENANCIFEAILEDLIFSLPVHEIYKLIWKLRLKMITRKLIDAGRKQCNDMNKLEVVIGTSKNFGIELGNLVKEFVEKKMYYSYIINDILKLIDNDTRNFELFISTGIDLKHDDMLVAVASGLVQLSLPETHSIALQLLPLNPDEDCNLVTYKHVLEAIRLEANSEMKSCMYSKYYGDCKRRRFL